MRTLLPLQSSEVNFSQLRIPGELFHVFFFVQDLRFCMPKLLCEEFSEEIFEKVDIFEKADIEEIGMGFKYAMCLAQL